MEGTSTDPEVGTTTAENTRRRRTRSKTSTSVATVRIALIRERGPVYAEPIRNAADIDRLLGPTARSWDRERFVSVILDGKSRVVAIDEVAVGTVTAALVHPREVLKGAILANGVSLIVVHNHPSGDCTPSGEDVALTRRLGSACELMGVRFLDHIVLGDGSFYSFSGEGQLE